MCQAPRKLGRKQQAVQNIFDVILYNSGDILRLFAFVNTPADRIMIYIYTLHMCTSIHKRRR